MDEIRDRNVINQIKDRQSFHCSISQFLPPVLSDMYSIESEICEFFVRLFISFVVSFIYIFAPAPVWNINKFFFRKTIPLYSSRIFLDTSLRLGCVFFTDNLCCVLVFLWLCCARKVICCHWTCCLTNSDYYIFRFPQTSSVVLI